MTEPSPTRPRRWRINPTAAVGGVALVAAVAGWLDSRSQVAALQQQLGKRLAEADELGKENRTIAKETQAAQRDLGVKLGLLESQVAESQSQQAALEALYQELARHRDDWALAEVEQLLIMAGQQLQLTGNLNAALAALQLADGRLQKLDQPQFIPLRKAMARDMEKLKTAPSVDVVGISARLDGLANQIEQLPLLVDIRPATPTTAPPQASASLWQRLAGDVWREVTDVVRIRKLQNPEAPLLSPGQSFFLRENLRLRLLSARVALLSRDQPGYRSDLRAAQGWLARYFDPKAAATISAKQTMTALEEATIAVEAPNIGGSLVVLRDLKMAMDRGK